MFKGLATWCDYSEGRQEGECPAPFSAHVSVSATLLESPLGCNGLQAGRGGPVFSGLGDLHGPAPRCCRSWIRGLCALRVPARVLALVCLLSVWSQTYACSTPQLLPSKHT